MVTPSQYPDVLTCERVTAGSSHYDSNGNLVVTQPTTETLTMRCRAQANTSGREIVATDGNRIIYDWYVLISIKDAKDIPAGTNVVITRKGVQRAKGSVKRCVIDQLNGKVWL